MGLFDRFRGPGANRVAVLGVAGLPFSLSQGQEPVLESLSELADRGRASAIPSVLPPDESACWPSLMAGANPGRTGVYGLLDREVGTYETYVPQGGDVQADRLWDYAEAADRSATVLNVPVTNPPQKEVRRMAAGPQAPDVDRAAQPAELREYLTGSDYRLDVDARLGQDGDLEALVTDARETLEARIAAFERYVDRDDWALFVGCLTATDRVNHFGWDAFIDGGVKRDAVSGFYDRLDAAIRSFRAALSEDTTFVLVGDHGFAPLEYEVDCQRWLAEAGLLSWDAEPSALSDLGADTQVFALPHGRFYLNRADREPRGQVGAAEADAVLEDLAAALRTLEGPEGREVIAELHRGEALYEGAHTDLAPDLVAIPEPGFDLTTSFDGPGTVFRETPRVGMHVPGDAPLVIDHPDAELAGASPFDVAPTVLELLDIDPGDAPFDGASLLR